MCRAGSWAYVKINNCYMLWWYMVYVTSLWNDLYLIQGFSVKAFPGFAWG